jgi:hypothetical protein
VTVAPALTVRVAGEKEKLDIVTALPLAGAVVVGLFVVASPEQPGGIASRSANNPNIRYFFTQFSCIVFYLSQRACHAIPAAFHLFLFNIRLKSMH